MPRRERIGPFPSRFAGFTRWRRREVQFPLDVLPHVAPEIHFLLTTPLVRSFSHRSRLGLSVDSTFRLRIGIQHARAPPAVARYRSCSFDCTTASHAAHSD